MPIFYMNSHKHVPAQQDVIKLFKAVKPGLLASYVIASRPCTTDYTLPAMKPQFFLNNKCYTFNI